MESFCISHDADFLPDHTEEIIHVLRNDRLTLFRSHAGQGDGKTTAWRDALYAHFSTQHVTHQVIDDVKSQATSDAKFSGKEGIKNPC